MTRPDDQLARYGARLGIVEPLFLRMARQIPELDAVVEELRAKRDFELSDRVRAVAQVMRDATEYAFPRGIPGSKASGWKRKMDGTVIRRDIE